MVQRQHGPVTSFQHSFLYSFFVILQRFQFSFAEQHTFPGGGVDLEYVRLVRLFRLVRTFRVVRTLPMFMTLRTMLNAIMNSVRSFLWAMVLVWFTMFMFAVAFAQGVTQHAQSSIVADSDMIVLRSYFPSLPATLLTLFMCVTGGVNWWEVINVLLNINAVFGLLFALYISLMVLALLNIVTGIFVNDALEFAQLDRDLMARFEMDRRKLDMEKLGKIFATVDVSNTGKISYDEFLVHMDSSEVKALFKVLGLDVSDVFSFFEALDVGGRGEVNLEEFVMGCLNLRGSAKTLDMATLMRENKRTAQRLDIHARRLEKQLKAVERRLPPVRSINTMDLARRASGEDQDSDVQRCSVRREPLHVGHLPSFTTLATDEDPDTREDSFELDGPVALSSTTRRKL